MAHQVPPAASAAMATTAVPMTSTLPELGRSAGIPLVGMACVWMPGTAPRPRSASARRSASRM